jgi:Cupredoxin-like domain
MMMRNVSPSVFALLMAGWLASSPALAAETSFQITIQGHQFAPDIIEVPAGQKIKLIIQNADPSAEEFESYELNREKVVPGGSQLVVFVGPLDPGEYPFFGDFNPKTAQGKLIAK